MLVALLAVPSPAALVVNSLANSGPGSLRNQVAAALPGDEIQFSVSGTINLSSAITIQKTLFINGPGPGKLTVSGGNNGRVFETGGNPVVIAGLAIADGLVTGVDGVDGNISQNGTPGTEAFGGAIVNNFNSDLLIVSNCWFHGNTVRGGKGGRGGDNGPLIVPGNGAMGGYAHGGAIFSTGIVEIANCTFSDNHAIGGKGGDGGKNNNLSPLASGAGGGGGDAACGAVEIINYQGPIITVRSTFSGNTAIAGAGGKGGDSDLAEPGGQGGNGGLGSCGAFKTFYPEFFNCTIVSNAAVGGAAGAGGSGVPPGSAGNAGGATGGGVCGYPVMCNPQIGNTIVADNVGDGCCPNYYGKYLDVGYNFIGTDEVPCGTAATTQRGTIATPLHPGLKPLFQGSSGLPTHATQTSSPVTDRGDSFSSTTDERGAPRPYDFNFIANAPGGDGSDIGAFELGNPDLGLDIISNNVVVSWPGYYDDFILQSTTNLLDPNSWGTVVDEPFVLGSQLVVTNGVTGASRFFRLISR